MKVLIGSDEHIYYYGGQYYVSKIGYNIYQRYLRVFEKLRVAVRVRVVDNINFPLSLYTPIDDCRIEIYPLPFFQGPKEYILQYIPTQLKARNASVGCDAGIFRMPSVIGQLLCKKFKATRTPYAIEVVANAETGAKTSSNIIHRLLLTKMNRDIKSLCGAADGVAYVTRDALQQIYPCNNNAFTTHYSSINLLDSFYINTPRKYVSKQVFEIIHVAYSISGKWKGHKQLIYMIKKVVDKGYNVKVTFVGKGKAIPEFEKLAKSLNIDRYVSFVGVLDTTTLREYLLHADMMVFPTWAEGLPRVIIEACAVGLPCISSPIDGIPELLSKDVLFMPDEIDKYADKIIEIISTPSYYEKLSRDNLLTSKNYQNIILQSRRDLFYTELKNIALKHSN
ncbi:MAG: glycosyltransferase family 4 protein [Alistipes sp.]